MVGNIGLAGLGSELREHLGFRRIEAGMRQAEELLPAVAGLAPDQPGAGVLTGLLAQWVDAGFACPDVIRQVLDRFPVSARRDLPFLDYVHLRIAEGFLAMSSEDLEQAQQHFLFVQSVEAELDEPQLLAVTNFWIARCLRKSGRYDDALGFVTRGKGLALACGYTPMAAVIEVLESWLAFQKGRIGEAAAILRRAEQVFSETDDYSSRGNIQSAYGRIARRKARYAEAIECFDRAIAEYRRHDPKHLHLARSLLNMAFVKRLSALQLQEKLDSEMARRRSTTAATDAAGPSRAERGRIEHLRADALAHLKDAAAIYRQHENHRGLAGVHINLGFLRLDTGDLEDAAHEAALGFENGAGKSDYIAMARARTLQCIVENARVEEQIGDAAKDAARAEEYAHEAVEFAERTQNRRLLARAFIWQGLTYTSEPLHRHDAAQRCLDRAVALLKPDSQEIEYSWQELELLKARLRVEGPIDPLLRDWSAGFVGDRTFQQITEEFAALIIPKVWEREGRKVSRVAAKLSISPKKVRRILQHAGLSGPAPSSRGSGTS
jgi:tetratricopeptide (TPR) repeat protein